MMCLAGVLGLGAAALGILGGAGDFGGLPILPSLPPTFVAMGDSIFGIDPLSAFFLVPVFLMGGLGALYATGYRPAQRHPRTSRRSGLFWGSLVAGLAILIIARNALAFLLGWEGMALSAFFLITLDDAAEETRGAGFVYLVATHVGTLLLFCLFARWRQVTGSFDLLPAAKGLFDPQAANLLFLLAFLAFGLKAGMMPLHFWLPGAHAAAPSHVSAMLSGVVLKMGIYGLMRFVLLLPDPPLLWGESIIALGAVSSLLGVAFAIAQHDLKRLLAYHSVENIGIILMGFGVALVGQSLGRPGLTVLGMGAALLHVWNHSVFKSLLFFAAGSVVERTGTRSIDRLGGLSRIMPWTAAFFLVGAVAISGLPPLNGFVSEFLVYVGAFRGSLEAGGGSVVPLVVIPVLAATGALALGCFVKVYGAIFLGAPRSRVRPSGGESASSMLLPMAVLSGICVFIGALPLLASRILDPVLSFWCLSTGQRFTVL
ncbi:MAG: proton-conducting transporter membrane subunit, partial [Spirochaetota bacterium]